MSFSRELVLLVACKLSNYALRVGEAKFNIWLPCSFVGWLVLLICYALHVFFVVLLLLITGLI